MTLPHVPILRFGRPYASLDRVTVTDHRTGEPIASISQANAGLIRRDALRTADARDALRGLACDELIDISARAGELYLHETLPLGDDGTTQSPDDYVRTLSATTGLPHRLVRLNMAKIHEVFTRMGTILAGLTRGLDHAAIDTGFGEQAGSPVSYFPVAEALGVVLPSNSPGVNSIWMPAIPLKTAVMLKPGREEPWTPLRIIRAWIAAGCPAEAFGFYPTSHEGADAILGSCGRGIIFGDTASTSRYAVDPRVQVHGPGYSKIVLGDDEADRWADHLDVIAESIVANGGRSCINASAVITPRHGRALAEALAQRLAAIEPRPADADDAELAGFANARLAEALDAMIDDGLATPGATDLTAEARGGSPRRVRLDAVEFLRPTVVFCDTPDHPLANREFLFPFASVWESPQNQILDRIGPSLVVTAITRDARFMAELLACPHIDRLNLGPTPTSRVAWDQPHEGNLFEFLYRRRAIQKVPA